MTSFDEIRIGDHVIRVARDEPTEVVYLDGQPVVAHERQPVGETCPVPRQPDVEVERLTMEFADLLLNTQSVPSDPNPLLPVAQAALRKAAESWPVLKEYTAPPVADPDEEC